MSKGSWQRPYDKKKFEDNWDRIFRKKEQKEALDELTRIWEDFEQETEEGCVDYEDYETWRSGTEEEDDTGC